MQKNRRMGDGVHGSLLPSLHKFVNFSATNVVKVVGKAGFGGARSTLFPPTDALVLAAIQRERRGEDDVKLLSNGAREELDVDVELHGGLVVEGGACNACYPVVFSLVVVCHCESVLVEVRVRCYVGHLFFFLLFYRG